MELRQARYVIAVAEELKFTAAARRCGISQPSLTNSIINLEHELGQPLFVRRPKVALTPFGRSVLRQMYRINNAAEAVVRLAEADASKSPQRFDDCVHNSQSAADAVILLLHDYRGAEHGQGARDCACNAEG